MINTTIDELVGDMNRRCYTIYINKLMKNFNKYKSQRELLIVMFRKAYNIEFDELDNYSDLKDSLGKIADGYPGLVNIVKQLKSRLTIKGLKIGHNATRNDLFIVAQLYVTVLKKYEAYSNLYKQLQMKPNLEEEISVKKRLKFAIITSKKDEKNIITLQNPTFNALNIEEIKEILGFEDHIECKTDEELMGFINKNERVFRDGFSSNYLIKGNVIYYNIFQTEIGL
ncbi:hypothetical protein LGK97_13965 [Clostridium sp. CS001]|uniref:hypothetical protein n=1 Tax=Clostridium sp. CS001 TaxID=2880648 RepID=UPI001CF0F311|nr:hypothetical protein [Clostridium sp. CS001]MCB2290848.1 hypothetical protein [Clostridium sp. CS001]